MTVRSHTVGDPSGTYWESFSKNGDDTPFLLRKKGLWPINRYQLNKDGLIQNFVFLYDNYGNKLNYGPYGVTIFGQASLNPVSWPSEAEVINKLADRWRNTDLDLGMYLSPEGRESVQMMITGLQKFTNSARSLRKGDFGGFLRNLNELPRHARKRSARAFNQGDISGSFLAAHLGWEPLIKDVYSASQGIDDIKDKPHRISARRAGKRVGVFLNHPAGSKTVLTYDVSVRLTLDITRAPTFAQRFGLDNPFRIAWELVPLSFVADYFLPIGSVIEAMGNVSALYGQHGFRKAYEGYRTEEVIPKGAAKLNSWGTIYSNREDISRLVWHSSFSRTKYTPSFQDPIKSLRVKLPKSVMKLSTLAALAHQSVLALK